MNAAAVPKCPWCDMVAYHDDQSECITSLQSQNHGLHRIISRLEASLESEVKDVVRLTRERDEAIEKKRRGSEHASAEIDRLKAIIDLVHEEHGRARDLLARAHALLEIAGEGKRLRREIATHLCWAQECSVESEGTEP